MSERAPGARGEGLASGARRMGCGTVEGAADGAEFGGVVTTVEGATVLVGAALALGSMLGALEGASADRSASGDGHATARGGGAAGRSADAIQIGSAGTNGKPHATARAQAR